MPPPPLYDCNALCKTLTLNYLGSSLVVTGIMAACTNVINTVAPALREGGQETAFENAFLSSNGGS